VVGRKGGEFYLSCLTYFEAAADWNFFFYIWVKDI